MAARMLCVVFRLRIADNVELNMSPEYGVSVFVSSKVSIICDAGAV